MTSLKTSSIEVVREGRTPNLLMTSLPRHEIQLVKVDGQYVSEGIHFGFLIRRTTVNICQKCLIPPPKTNA